MYTGTHVCIHEGSLMHIKLISTIYSILVIHHRVLLRTHVHRYTGTHILIIDVYERKVENHFVISPVSVSFYFSLSFRNRTVVSGKV